MPGGNRYMGGHPDALFAPTGTWWSVQRTHVQVSIWRSSGPNVRVRRHGEAKPQQERWVYPRTQHNVLSKPRVKVTEEFSKLYRKMGLSHPGFSREYSERYDEYVQRLWAARGTIAAEAEEIMAGDHFLFPGSGTSRTARELIG